MYPWILVALLSFSGCLNYMDRQAVFSVFPLLRRNLGMTDFRLAMLGTSFLWCYAFSSPLAGFCGDRFRRRTVILVSLAIFSAITAASGYSPSGNVLVSLRAFLGISEALYMPAAVALISDWHSERTRGLAVGIHQSSLLVGGVFGATLAGYIGQAYGWRPTFYLLGFVGLVLSIVFLGFLREAPTSGLRDDSWESGKSPDFGPTLALILRTPTAICIIVNSFVVSMITWVILVWMPSYLHDRFQLTLGSAAFNSTIWASVAGLAALPLGGWLADRWVARSSAARPWVQGIGLALLVPAMLLLGQAKSLPLFLSGLVFYGVGQAVWNSGNMPILCEVVATDARATAYGLTNFAGTLGGGLSVLFFAAAAKSAGVSFVFGALGVLVALSLLLVIAVALRFHPRDRLSPRAIAPIDLASAKNI